MKKLILFVSIAALTVAGCIYKNPEVNEEKPSALTGSWKFVQFQSMSDEIGTITPDDPTLYTVELFADSAVSMRLNCNRANGRWTHAENSDSSGSIQFDPLIVTKALCPPPSMDERIARDMSYIRSYILRQDTLFLSLMMDGGIYTLVRDQISYASPAEGGPRNWIVPDTEERLALYSERSGDAKIITNYLPGTLLDNLGCESVSGAIWCYVQELGGGPVGYIPAERLEPAKAPGGWIPTGEDDSAYRLGQGEFDARGNIPCARYNGQPVQPCAFKVARAGGGYATVEVDQNGTDRILFFRLGIPIGVSTVEVSPTGAFSYEKEADLYLIRVGEERYEIPEAVIFGG